ncbi:MAG: acyl carrier protein [Tissierellia bacterium]|nr:acyl carrier protein [Tissierellia bacterium]
MVLNKVIYLLAEILGVDNEDINEKTEFTEEYGISSIDVAKLIIAVEEEFNIVIHDDKAAFFRSVGDMVDYIRDYYI